MKAYLRVISAITLICFSLTNISFAQDINSFKLAAPSSFSGMKGPEFKESAQIQAGVREALKGLQAFDIDSIRSLGSRPFAEKTVFTRKISGTIYFAEVREYGIKDERVYTESGSYLVKAVTAGDNIYYCLLSKAKSAGSYDISVVPERVVTEALQKGVVKFTHDSVAEKDREIIDTYLEHELSAENNTAIDEWIADKMDKGEYALADGLAQESKEKALLYSHPGHKEFYRDNYSRAVRHIINYLRTLGVAADNIEKIECYLHSKTLVLIPYDHVKELPTIKIGAEKVNVYGHSSKSATYAFVPRILYSNVEARTREGNLGSWDIELEQYVIDVLRHELGASCGKKAYIKNGQAWNILDKNYKRYKDLDRKRLKSIPPSDLAELRDLAPVDFMNLELRNDYAAGKVVKEKILKTLMTVVALAGGYYLVYRIIDETAPMPTSFNVRKYTKYETMKKLIESLGSPDPNVRMAATRVLVSIGEPAVPALKEALKNEDGMVREGAEKVLKEIPKDSEDDSIPPLTIFFQQKNNNMDEKGPKMPIALWVPVERQVEDGNLSDDDIRLVATRIKEAGIELFVPSFQFPKDTTIKYRNVIESIGGSLRTYQNVEHLQTMIKNPAKSIVMTVDVSERDAALLEKLKSEMEQLRFMNFAKMDDLDKMSPEEIDNYQADILSMLLVARVITPEDFQDKGSPTYRLLSNLLEDYIPEGITIENYIQCIVTNAAKLIKTILKALPTAAYKTMRQAVEALWSV